jgi:hypothetical protein
MKPVAPLTKTRIANLGFSIGFEFFHTQSSQMLA